MLGKLVQQALVGSVTGNRRWVSLRYRIMVFTINHDTRLNLDRAKKVKSLEDRLFRVVEGDYYLAVDLACGGYKGFVVQSRLSRVPKETVKRNAFAREKEFWRFPCQYIESIKYPDEHMLWSNHDIREAFRAHFWDHFTACLISRYRNFAAIYLTSPAFRRRKQLAGCRTCLTLFWWMCSTIGLSREPSLVTLPRERSHWWRKVAACHQWFGQTWVELCCEGKINPRQPALGPRNPRGNRRQHWSHADQFRSIQNLQ